MNFCNGSSLTGSLENLLRSGPALSGSKSVSLRLILGLIPKACIYFSALKACLGKLGVFYLRSSFPFVASETSMKFSE